MNIEMGLICHMCMSEIGPIWVFHLWLFVKTASSTPGRADRNQSFQYFFKPRIWLAIIRVSGALENLENLEKSGKFIWSGKVREKSGKFTVALEKQQSSTCVTSPRLCGTHIKVDVLVTEFFKENVLPSTQKTWKPKSFRGLCPGPRWGSSQRSPWPLGSPLRNNFLAVSLAGAKPREGWGGASPLSQTWLKSESLPF